MRRIVITFSLVLLSSCLFATGQIETQEVFVLKIRESIEIDGLLNERVWKRAPDASDLLQFKPEKGKRDPLNTTVKILYDDSNLYIGFLCYDPQPSEIKARVRERDKDLRIDDSVYVILDTLSDTEYFYYFATNLYGTKLDGRITLDGQRADVRWDGVWKSSSQKTDFGWSVEIAINLSSFGFDSKEDITIGLSLSRLVARAPRNIFLEGPLDPAFKVSLLGQIEKINLYKVVKKVSISPHLLAASEEWEYSWFEWGLDVSYSPHQMLFGRLTVNPEFATVEPDEERINLTRFELFLPEKRDYFLEGIEHYEQPILLFYSKRIPDIFGGIKLSGRSKGFGFSGMSVQAREDAYTGDDSANYSVIRFKQKVMKDSSIGFLSANKLMNGKSTGTAGVDTLINITRTFSVIGQFAASYGDYQNGNIALFLRPSYDSTNFHFHLGYVHMGENFGENVNEVGFIEDDNRKELDSGLGITFFRNKWIFEKIRYNSNYNIYWGMNGSLRSWQVDQGVTFDLKDRFSLIASHTEEFKAQEDFLFEEDFRNHLTKLGVGFNMKEWEFAVIYFSFGRNFGDEFTMLEVGKNLHIAKSFDVEFTMANIFFYGGSERNQFVPVLKARYHFSRNFLLNLFYQMNTLIDKSNIELLLTYRLLPPYGFIQLAYQIGRGRFGESTTFGDTLFLKLSYTF